MRRSFVANAYKGRYPEQPHKQELTREDVHSNITGCRIILGGLLYYFRQSYKILKILTK